MFVCLFLFVCLFDRVTLQPYLDSDLLYGSSLASDLQSSCASLSGLALEGCTIPPSPIGYSLNIKLPFPQGTSFAFIVF